MLPIGGGRVGIVATEREMRIVWKYHFMQCILLNYKSILYIKKEPKEWIRKHPKNADRAPLGYNFWTELHGKIYTKNQKKFAKW